jgi:hypothetical protein
VQHCLVGSEMCIRDRLRTDAAQELLISRRSELRSLPLRCAAPRVERYQLTRDPQASRQALERQRRWLRLWEAPW